MSNTESEELRRAREEARRAREEARRLRDQANELERRLRQEERRVNDREREHRRRFTPGGPDFPFGRGPRPPRQPFGPAPYPPEIDGDGDGPHSNVRAEQGFALEGIREVTLDQTAGKVFVRYCREGETPGVVTYGTKTTPSLEVSRSPERIEIRVQISTGSLFRRRTGQSTIVRLKPGLEHVRVDLGAGECEVRDIETATMRIQIGAGEVKCLGTATHMDAKVGAGRVSLQAHKGLARVDVGTGDVLMDIAGVETGEYRGNAGMGRVEVRLAPGHQVHTRTQSRIGKGRVQYPDAGEGAPTQVRVNSGIGEAVVTTRKTSDDPFVTPDPRSTASSKPQREGRAEVTRRRREAEELRVLQMLEQGKITSSEAADLMAALQGMSRAPDDDDFDGEDRFEQQAAELDVTDPAPGETKPGDGAA